MFDLVLDKNWYLATVVDWYSEVIMLVVNVGWFYRAQLPAVACATWQSKETNDFWPVESTLMMMLMMMVVVVVARVWTDSVSDG